MNASAAAAGNETILVFDLDGVITDPADSSVDEAAVRYIHAALRKGRYVAINTGRSYEWVVTYFLGAFRSMGELADYTNLFIVCEKGGESVRWIHGEFLPQPSRFAVAEDDRAVARRIYEAHKAELSSMFWDATKQTMITIEKRPSADLAHFREQQRRLVRQLQEAFAGRKMKIDPTTIATDVESPHAGKHAGAELIYEWVKAHTGNRQLHFTSFGDSASDYDMAVYFAAQGAASVFVFVGNAADVPVADAGVVLVRPKARYAAGTREYFEQYSIRKPHSRQVIRQLDTLLKEGV